MHSAIFQFCAHYENILISNHKTANGKLLSRYVKQVVSQSQPNTMAASHP
jgi:hypothetical protein